jgi:dihydroflavonol-4-reductase
MKALVTGATGFVGAAVARALLAAGWEVRVLVRGGSDRSNLQHLAVEAVEGDLAEVVSLERALPASAESFTPAALRPSAFPRTARREMSALQWPSAT